MTIESFLNVNEIDGSIHLKLLVEFSWKDHRLMFQNLNKDNDLNTLSKNEMKKIWLPEIDFPSTRSITYIELSDNQTYAHVFMSKYLSKII